jgi:tetratricopeptide (TPR) repeat protein
MAEHLISGEEAESNLLSCAAFLAEGIKSSDGHSEAIKAILPFYLAKADVDTAAEFANTVDDPFVRDKLLTLVAEKCAAIDDDEYAFQLVEAIEDHGMQLQARERIAIQKSAKSDFDKAFEIADTLEHPDNVFAAIAVNASEDGDDPTALEAVEEIAFPYAKVVTLQSIAGQKHEKGEKQAALEYLEKGLTAADEIDFVEEKLRAMTDLANHFTDAGRKDRAIETLDKARAIAVELDNVHRDSFLSIIAYGFFRAGSIELADRALDLVADKSQIASTLVGFSREYWMKGEKEAAVETLEESYAILKSQHERETRDSRAKFALFATIAAQFANYEMGERAIGIASEIPYDESQPTPFAKIAEILTVQGKDDLARVAIEAINEEYLKAFALIDVADAKYRLEKKAEAVETLDQAYFHSGLVPQLTSRSSAFNELIPYFADWDEPAKARAITHENLETIAEIRNPSSQTVALARLAEIYEKYDYELTDAEKAVLQGIIRKAEA